MSTPKSRRSYPLGHRNRPNARNDTPGQMSPSKWAWAQLNIGQFIIWGDYQEDDEGEITEEVRDIKLIYPIPKRQPVVWNLTGLTEDELMSLKHLLDTAFAWALPLVQKRDKEAQDAFENGDDSHSRIYRQVPKLVYRSGPKPEHGEGIQHGPSDDDAVSRDESDLDGGLRGDESGMAEQDSTPGITEDDGPETD